MSRRRAVASATIIFTLQCSGNDQENLATDSVGSEEKRQVLSAQDEGALKLSDGQDLFQNFPKITAKASSETSIPITWPALAGLKSTLVDPPCATQEGFTSHPYQDPLCLGFLRMTYRAGPVKLNYNSGISEEYLGVKGLRHSQHYEIRLASGQYSFHTPSDRIVLANGTAANTLVYANPIYGDTLFTKDGDTIAATMGVTTWMFLKFNGQDKYLLQSLTNPLARTVYIYDPSTGWPLRIENTDLRVGGKTEIIVHDYSNLASSGIVTFKVEGSELQAKVTIVNGAISLIERQPEDTKIEVTSQTYSGKTFPVGFFNYTKNIRTEASYYGLDRDGHILYEHHKDETKTYSYGLSSDGVSRYTSWTDRYGRQYTRKFKTHGSYLLPVGLTNLSGDSLSVYQTSFPHYLSRLYNPLEGWTDVSYSGTSVMTVTPNVRSYIQRKIEGGHRTERSDGSFTERTTQILNTNYIEQTFLTGNSATTSSTTITMSPQQSKVASVVVDEKGNKVDEREKTVVFNPDGSSTATVKNLLKKTTTVTVSNTDSIVEAQYASLQTSGTPLARTEMNLTDDSVFTKEFVNGALITQESTESSSGVYRSVQTSANFLGNADSNSATVANEAGEYSSQSWFNYNGTKKVGIYAMAFKDNSVTTSKRTVDLTAAASSSESLSLNGNPNGAGVSQDLTNTPCDVDEWYEEPGLCFGGRDDKTGLCRRVTIPSQ